MVGVLSRGWDPASMKKLCLKPLRDPKGYLSGHHKDTYEENMGAPAQDIEDGFLGTTYMDYVLDHLDSTVRKDSKLLTWRAWWRADLRFIKNNTFEIQDKNW